MKKFIKILFIAISVILLLGIEFIALVVAGNKIGLSTDTVFYSSIIITFLTLVMLMIWQYVKTVKMIKNMADAGLIDINNYTNNNKKKRFNHNHDNSFNDNNSCTSLSLEARINYGNIHNPYNK